MISQVTTTPSRVLHLRLKEPKECSRALEDLSRLQGVKHGNDLLSRQIDRWIKGAFQLSEQILNSGQYTLQDQTRIFDHIAKLVDEILVNPLHPGLPLENPVIDREGRVWEFGAQNIFPSFAHYLEVAPKKEELAEANPHLMAQGALHWIGKVYDRSIPKPQFAANDEASIKAYFQAYLELGAQSLHRQRQEELALLVSESTTALQTLQKENEEEIQLLVAYTKEQQIAYDKRHRAHTAALLATHETQTSLLATRVEGAENLLTITRGELAQTAAKCQLQSEQIGGLQRQCADMARQIEDLSRRANSGGGLSCSLM
jgi:hypothetical protein